MGLSHTKPELSEQMLSASATEIVETLSDAIITNDRDYARMVSDEISDMGTDRERAVLRRACRMVMRKPSATSRAVLVRAITVVRHRRFMRARVAVDDVLSRRFEAVYRTLNEEQRKELDRSAIAMHELYEMGGSDEATGRAIESAITSGQATALLSTCECVGLHRKSVTS